jgi:hypothetical protein
MVTDIEYSEICEQNLKARKEELSFLYYFQALKERIETVKKEKMEIEIDQAILKINLQTFRSIQSDQEKKIPLMSSARESWYPEWTLGIIRWITGSNFLWPEGDSLGCDLVRINRVDVLDILAENGMV